MPAVGRHNASDKGKTTLGGGSQCANDHVIESPATTIVLSDYTTTLQNATGDFGAPTVLVNGFKGAIIGSLGDTDCSLGDDGPGATAEGHTPSQATVGSSTVFFGGKAVHRVGDAGTNPGGGTYILDTGSSNVFAG